MRVNIDADTATDIQRLRELLTTIKVRGLEGGLGVSENHYQSKNQFSFELVDGMNRIIGGGGHIKEYWGYLKEDGAWYECNVCINGDYRQYATGITDRCSFNPLYIDSLEESGYGKHRAMNADERKLVLEYLKWVLNGVKTYPETKLQKDFLPLVSEIVKGKRKTIGGTEVYKFRAVLGNKEIEILDQYDNFCGSMVFSETDGAYNLHVERISVYKYKKDLVFDIDNCENVIEEGINIILNLK